MLFLPTGMCIYFFYGIHHSVEGQRQKEQGNYIPLEQVDKEDPEETPEEPQPKTDEDKPDEAKEKTDDKNDKFTAPS